MNRAPGSLRTWVAHAPVSALALASLITLGVGCAGTVMTMAALGYRSPAELQQGHSLRLAQSSYPLVSPLLLCNVEPKDSTEDKKMTQAITSFIDGRVAAGSLEKMSVYIINYQSGQWVGVNENERYDPASLLKVPLMIAYLRAAESNPDLLSQKVNFNGNDQNANEYFKSPDDIKAGVTYTVSDLIKSMIVNSDNTAAVLLNNLIDKKSQTEVYTDLGIPVPPNSGTIEYLSAKLYAYFFRVLYNTTYLTEKDSEKALELLTAPDIPAIRAGVPGTVAIAQKFGERTLYDTDGTTLLYRELHDCGIVYKPGSPYLICVMTRGKDFDTLTKDIADLSALVYQSIH